MNLDFEPVYRYLIFNLLNYELTFDVCRYRMFNLLNHEFTFDVDLSTLDCGLNGALYFVEMDADGGKSK